jgi:hypothetical protein
VRSQSKTGGEMSEIINTAVDDSNKYLLHDQERWENLEFDWEGWNATVAKILQQKSAANPFGQE